MNQTLVKFFRQIWQYYFLIQNTEITLLVSDNEMRILLPPPSVNVGESLLVAVMDICKRSPWICPKLVGRLVVGQLSAN